MQDIWVLAAGLAVVLIAGGWWILRSATRGSTVEDADLDPDEPVVVSRGGSEMEIETLRAKLEAFGIDAYTRNRSGRIMPGGVPPVLFGWEVLVRRSDLEQAEAILSGIEEQPTDG
jgi:hypothetical protein